MDDEAVRHGTGRDWAWSVPPPPGMKRPRPSIYTRRAVDGEMTIPMGIVAGAVACLPFWAMIFGRAFGVVG